VKLQQQAAFIELELLHWEEAKDLLTESHIDLREVQYNLMGTRWNIWFAVCYLGYKVVPWLFTAVLSIHPDCSSVS